MNYCPLFFNLKDKECIVVGGGEVACRRIKKLLDYGAVVRLISPEVLPGIEEILPADRIQKTAYKREFIRGVFLVIAATNNLKVNRQIYDDSRKLNIFVNVVDQPKLCDIIFPAIFKRGDLQIAISTSARNPGLSKKIRQKLAGSFREDYQDTLRLAGDIRSLIKEEVKDIDKRRIILEKLTCLID